MKPIKLLITTVLTLLISLTVQAQSNLPTEGWAGEDKTILRLPDSSQTVTIGKPNSGSNVCFEWEEDSTIVSDRFQAEITVNPQERENTYTVHRYSECGDDIQQVKVWVTDTVRLVSVTATKCYNDGDTINKSDFKIVTSPEGLDDLVEFSPIIADHHVSFGNPEKLQTESFKLNHNNLETIQEVQVLVINENLSSTIDVEFDFKDFEKKIAKAQAMLEDAKQVKDKLDVLADGVSPCEPDIDGDFSRFGTPHFSCYCCEGKKVNTFSLTGPKLSGHVGFGCAFPIPNLSIPGVGGVSATIGAEIGINLGPLNIRFRGECGQADFPVELYGEISGGVMVSAVSDDFLSASLKIVGGAKTGMTWVIGKKVEVTTLEASVSLKGEVKALSLFTYTVNVPLGIWQLF